MFDFMPVLSSGAHNSPQDGACVMEYISLLAGEDWSDTPSCTHPALAKAAQIVNDRLYNNNRYLIVPLIGRLFGTADVGTDEERKRVSVGLAQWCAAANATAATNAAYAADAADAAYAAAYAANATAATAYAAAAAAVAAATKLVSFLSNLIDEYDRLTGRESYDADAPVKAAKLYAELIK